MCGEKTWTADRAYRFSSTLHALEKVRRARARLEEILGARDEGETLFSEDYLRSQQEVHVQNLFCAGFPVLEKDLSERGIQLPPREGEEEIPPEKAMEAIIFLFVYDILRENGLVERDSEGNFRLTREVSAGECRVRIRADDLLDFDPLSCGSA